MKKLIILLFLVLCFTLTSNSKEQFEVKIYGGPIFPINSFGNFTNSDSLMYFVNDTTKLNGLISKNDTKTGYLIGFQGSMNLSNDIQFYGSLEFNRFNTNENRIYKNNSNEEFTSVDVMATIIPFTAGVNYYLMKGPIGVYILGDISYNFTTYHLDYPLETKKLDVSSTLSKGRFGSGTGMGFEIELDKLVLSLDYKYKNYNFIGKDDNENTMNGHIIRFGIIF